MRAVVTAILVVASTVALADEPVHVRGEETVFLVPVPEPEVALTIARKDLTEVEVQPVDQARPTDKVVASVEGAPF